MTCGILHSRRVPSAPGRKRLVLTVATALLVLPTSSTALPAPQVRAPAPLTEDKAAFTGRFALHFEEGPSWKPLTYTTVNGIVLIAGTLNDRPITMMLDNGATRTMVDLRLARSMGLDAKAVASNAITGSGTSLRLFETSPVALAAPNSFALNGNLAAADLSGVAGALGRKVDVVLGADVIKNVALMIQPRARLISVAPSGSIKGGRGLTLPLIDGDKVDMVINGTSVRLAVDLGFNGTIRLTDDAWDRTFNATKEPVETSTMTTATGRSKATRRARAPVRMGPTKSDDVSVDSGFVSKDGASGIIGTSLLLNGTLVLDYKAASIGIYPS